METITDHSEAERMRVVSWNVNGIRACVRHGFVDFVDRSSADIVGSPAVHVGPKLAEGAPGGPVTGAFPGFRWVCL